MFRLAICVRVGSDWRPVSFRPVLGLLLVSTAAAVVRQAAVTLHRLYLQQHARKEKRRSTMSVLKEVRQAGTFGIDVGGTRAKVVIAEDMTSGSGPPALPEFFGEDGEDGQPAGHTHRRLSLHICRRPVRDLPWAFETLSDTPDEKFRLQFVSGGSDALTLWMVSPARHESPHRKSPHRKSPHRESAHHEPAT